MQKLNVCVLFGGISPEHEVSLRSAESVLNNMDSEKYNIFRLALPKKATGSCLAVRITRSFPRRNG